MIVMREENLEEYKIEMTILQTSIKPVQQLQTIIQITLKFQVQTFYLKKFQVQV